MKPKHCQKPQQQPKASASSKHLTTMESLALPQDLYWDGKSEPNSPPNHELFTITTDLVENEQWLYDDYLANEILLLCDDKLELKPSSEILCDLIDNGELVVELSDLADEAWPPQTADVSNQLASYSEINGLIPVEQLQQPDLYTKSYDYTNYTEQIFGSENLSTLTPPQSPPRNVTIQQQTLHDQHEIAPMHYHTLHYRPAAASIPIATTTTNDYVHTELLQQHQHANNIDNDNNVLSYFPIASTDIEVKDEIEQAKIVDQIIEQFAKDLPDMSDEYESHYTYSPPSQLEESSIDEEWTPPSSAGSSPVHECNSSSSSSSSCSSVCGDEEKTTTTNNKKRRPYGRGVEDRKIRKKEQNKNAATRYRQKKKIEMELVLQEEQQLSDRNSELNGKLNKCNDEIRYLKELIREFYRKKRSA